MRRKTILLLFFLFIGGILLWAQDVPAGVVAAFKQGDSKELGKFLGEQVELIIENKSAQVDRKKGEGTMASFFSNHKVNDFSINHKGKRGESGFIVGTLATVNGSYRVNCFFKKIQNTYIIHQIRIDKNHE